MGWSRPQATEAMRGIYHRQRTMQHEIMQNGRFCPTCPFSPGTKSHFVYSSQRKKLKQPFSGGWFCHFCHAHGAVWRIFINGRFCEFWRGGLGQGGTSPGKPDLFSVCRLHEKFCCDTKNARYKNLIKQCLIACKLIIQMSIRHIHLNKRKIGQKELLKSVAICKIYRNNGRIGLGA